MCVDDIHGTPPIPPRSTPPAYPLNFVSCFWFLKSSISAFYTLLGVRSGLLDHGHPTIGPTIKENGLFLFYQYPLQYLLTLVVFYIQPSSPSWYLVCLELPQVLCMLSQLLGVHICSFSTVSDKHCFLIVIPWLLKFFCLLFCNDLWALGEGCDTDVPFRTEYSVVSNSLYFDQLRVPN